MLPDGLAAIVGEAGAVSLGSMMVSFQPSLTFSRRLPRPASNTPPRVFKAMAHSRADMYMISCVLDGSKAPSEGSGVEIAFGLQ